MLKEPELLHQMKKLLCDGEPDKHRPILKFYDCALSEESSAKMLLSPALNTMLNTKRNRFANKYHPTNAVYPGTFRTFLLTAGDANGQDADRLMNFLVKSLTSQIPVETQIVRKFVHRTGTLLGWH